MQQQLKQIGIGSSFHKVAARSLLHFSFQEHIPSYALFYTGRHAIRHIIDGILQHTKVKTIWLPAYYCQHVTAWLKEVYQEQIRTYQIYPFASMPVFSDFSFAQVNDVVICNNFWGLYTYAYPTDPHRPIFIEDHSHGWLSHTCMASTADYCFASLRKTLPVPLGGISWSTTQAVQAPIDYTSEQNEFNHAWDEIGRAMQLKTNLLEGDDTIQKSDYLALINQFEAFLHQQHQVVSVLEPHEKELRLFLNKNYAFYKKENLTYLWTKIKESNLFYCLPFEKNFSFGLELVFNHRDALQRVKTYLVQHHIYPSELWPENSSPFEEKFLLNIHVDFRYTTGDMDYIAKTLNQLKN